jgi:hypothetical protein
MRCPLISIPSETETEIDMDIDMDTDKLAEATSCSGRDALIRRPRITATLENGREMLAVGFCPTT